MLSMAARTALAMSSLRSMKDWLSMALTFTVICGAELDWLLFPAATLQSCRSILVPCGTPPVRLLASHASRRLLYVPRRQPCACCRFDSAPALQRPAPFADRSTLAALRVLPADRSACRTLSFAPAPDCSGPDAWCLTPRSHRSFRNDLCSASFHLGSSADCSASDP
jgi:hypothetical protein